MVDAYSLRRPDLRIGWPLVLLTMFLALLWLAGGASRADVMGQVIVRAGAWAVLIWAALLGPRPSFADMRPVLWLFLAIAALPLVQLVPLPPGVWQALPGREVLVTPGEPIPWRPITMAPGATYNALASLVVPAAILVLLAQMDERARRWLPVLLLSLVTASMLLGLLQFSGARFNNPFINDAAEVSGSFANRNHFALFLAIGCVLAPVWAFRGREKLRLRGLLASGVILLFVLTILATGSRAGLLLGAAGLALGVVLVLRRLRRRLSGAPAWVLPSIVAALMLVIAGFVAISVSADRAVGIDRLIVLDGGEDMRRQGLPTVLSMIATYFPAGSGFGGFDPVFRIHEPDSFLAITYFNRAHNDFLEIALDGGIAGMALLAAALGWWLWASWRVWRAEPSEEATLARLGSAMLLLVLIASVPDYPARTPMIMAIVAIAATWLSRETHRTSVALPARA
jgi:O-antigen ligase